MAKEECITQCNKTGDTSTLRNRKVCPTPEKTSQAPSSRLSRDKPSQSAGHHLSGGDTQSSNGTSARCPAKEHGNNEAPSRVLLMMLVVGLSFSTRLYKITEPPHVWWVDFVHFSVPFYYLCFYMMTCFGVSAGTRHTLERWGATTSTGPSFSMSILLSEKWDGRVSLIPFVWAQVSSGKPF